MQYNQITYSRQRNLGNYESERIEMVVTVEEHENADVALRNVKIKVAQGLGLQPKVEQIDEVVEGGDVITADGKQKDPATGEETKKKTKKKVAKKKSASKKTAKSTPKAEESLPQEPTEEGAVEAQPSFEAVKEVLVKVWKGKGKPVAESILKEFGVTKSNELKEEQYAEVIAECEKCLA